MKYTMGIILAAALCYAPLAAQTAAADGAIVSSALTDEQPLMIIRFNQLHVPYQTPLYNTISSALKVKPAAVFDIVSVAPRGYDADSQSHNNKVAAQHAHNVLSTLHEIGLPANRISLTYAIDSVYASEVRIFVH